MIVVILRRAFFGGSLVRPPRNIAPRRPIHIASAGSRAFSSEVETGSRWENASDQESRAPFRFNRDGKRLWREMRLDRSATAAVEQPETWVTALSPCGRGCPN